LTSYELKLCHDLMVSLRSSHVSEANFLSSTSLIFISLDSTSGHNYSQRTQQLYRGESAFVAEDATNRCIAKEIRH
jgi:hypothetical protein